MIKVALLGLGRTGAVVAAQLLNSPPFELVSVLAKPGSPRVGRPLSEFINTESADARDITVVAATQLHQEILAKKFKVAIDFTAPEATLQNARVLAEHGIHLVIGTTGFHNMQLYELKQLVHQHRIGLVYAPNISVGINLLLSVVKTIARLAPQYDVEITETCHREKQDAPSGTALKIASELNSVLGVKKRGERASGQCGRKGKELRQPGEIGIHSLRAGGNIGVHQVLFAGESEEIEITHRSYSRVTYAEGALKAAAFINNLKGFYHMEDVLLNERMERDLRVAANRLFLKFN